MPRKGPKKTTARDERDEERAAERGAEKAAERRELRKADLLKSFDEHSRPEMPEGRADQRLLRSGLSERGMVLERFGKPGDAATLAPSEIAGSDNRARRVFKERAGETEMEDDA